MSDKINLYLRLQNRNFAVPYPWLMVQEIRIADYDYPLPEARIARYPLARRDDSQLLVYTEASHRLPENRKFRDLAAYLPEKSIMVFNNTKVVPARLLFQKDTGALIEVFCLEPADPQDYEQCFASTDSCVWKAIIGNVKRWKSGFLKLYIAECQDNTVLLQDIDLTAELVERSGQSSLVRFSWKGGLSFSQVMLHAGRIPIPPYLRRDTEAIDLERYQTWYARREGSVAAPTAGLHFTQKELQDIDLKGIKRYNLCLHVGAGTFLPVKSDTISDHSMHSEPFSVSRELLLALAQKGETPLIAVGTTSTRCLESLYFLGIQCIEKGEPGIVEQWEPYREEGYTYSLRDSMNALLAYMDAHQMAELTSRTQIIIVPGYSFRVIDYLVTNFHQPKSTLLLLIGAFVGEAWHDIYGFALDNGFRFLSYGDSSLLQRKLNK